MPRTIFQCTFPATSWTIARYVRAYLDITVSNPSHLLRVCSTHTNKQVMALPPIPPATPDGDAVLEIYEPWKVRTGDHVLHTHKVNLGDRFMLGAFILVDDVHLGEVR